MTDGQLQGQLDRTGFRSSSAGPDNWVDALERQAALRQDHSAFVFLNGEGEEVQRRTYAEFSKRVKALAAHVQQQASAGSNVILFYPQELSFVDAFFAVIYAGSVPVPAFAPDAHRNNFARLEAIVRDCGARHLLTDSASAKIIHDWAADSPVLAALDVIETDGIESSSERDWQKVTPSPTDIAFLQYTSGSTGTPKGVMVTHANLLANTRLLQQFYRTDAESTFVTWVPLYHDLGLIGNVFFSLSVGARCVLMAPESFIRSPLNWLRAIERYRADISFAPTFAYDFTLKHVRDLESGSLDLSSWRTAVVGAEPIYPATIERFSRAMSKFGFHRSAFQCAYGLAESTLMVVTTPPGGGVPVTRFDALLLEQGKAETTEKSDARDARDLVSSGRIGEGHAVAIVDPSSGRELADGEVGEIWLAGPSIAAGYYCKEAETRATFENLLSTRPNQGPFLRSGDLGFIRRSELHFVTRAKDLIIVNGANHYPQDVEATAFASDPALRPGCAAAFAVERAEAEVAVIVLEVRDARAERSVLERTLRQVSSAVQQTHGIGLHDVVLIPAGVLSKTSSGKIQRQLMKLRYLEGALPSVLSLSALKAQPTGIPRELLAMTNWMHLRLAEAVGGRLADVRMDLHVTQLGMNSVKVVALLGEISKKFNIPEDKLTPWEHESVEAWVQHLYRDIQRPQTVTL